MPLPIFKESSNYPTFQTVEPFLSTAKIDANLNQLGNTNEVVKFSVDKPPTKSNPNSTVGRLQFSTYAGEIGEELNFEKMINLPYGISAPMKENSDPLRRSLAIPLIIKSPMYDFVKSYDETMKKLVASHPPFFREDLRTCVPRRETETQALLPLQDQLGT